MSLDLSTQQLARWIKESSSVLILTGAGMDTESNIPDFRGKEGWWRKLDPREVASTHTLSKNYTLFQEFYAMRYELLRKISPHEGHEVVAWLEKEGLIQGVATQNVSRLHRLAGSKTVYELHGNIQTFRCHSCEGTVNAELFLEKEGCPHCESPYLRPNVTLFGEILPQNAWDRTFELISGADLLLIIGTSLEVAPVNQLPYLCRGKKVYINRSIPYDYGFDLTIEGSAREVLVTLKEKLKEMD